MRQRRNSRNSKRSKKKSKLPKIILGGDFSEQQDENKKSFNQLKNTLRRLQNQQVRYGDFDFVKNFRVISDITLTGYLVNLMKAIQRPIMVKEMLQDVIPVIDALRKANGCKYKGDIVQTINGCLKSNKVFKRVMKNDEFTKQWSLLKKHVPQFEKVTSQKIIDNYEKRKNKYRNSKIQKRSLLSKRKQKQLNKFKPKKISKIVKKKNIRKMLKKYSIAFKVLNNALEFEKQHSKNDQTNIFLHNPLKNLTGKEEYSLLLSKIGNMERILGMLDCYDFFKPLLNDEYLKDLQKIEDKQLKETPKKTYIPLLNKQIDDILKQATNMSNIKQ